MNPMTLHTAEEFAELELDDRRWELVRGVLQVRDANVKEHGYIAAEMAYRIRSYLDTNPIGVVLIEVFYTTKRAPDTVRVPDVSFVTLEHFYQMPQRQPADTTHDLAVEVLSPSNRPKEITQKVGEYLEKGTRLVWIIDPKTRTVAVFAPDALPHRLGVGEFLDGGEVLPGFRLAVEKIFDIPDPLKPPGNRHPELTGLDRV